MTRDEIDNRIAEILMENGPDGHCDGHEKITDFVMTLLDRPGPLLQCIDCKNTESPAGAMARFFNKGRCLRCAGYFKVVRA